MNYYHQAKIYSISKCLLVALLASSSFSTSLLAIPLPMVTEIEEAIAEENPLLADEGPSNQRSETYLPSSTEAAISSASIRPVDRIVITAEENIIKLTTQIEQAKQASKEKLGGENDWLWDCIATKLEQARDSWNKVNELTTRGREERASFWRKAAEDSEASAEGMRQLVMSYISGQKETAKQLEKASWNRYHLSDAFTWSLKSEEALDKADQIQGKEGDFWRDIAEQYKIASNYKKKAAEV
ncbi:MAG TPA: hypothetical protein VJK54_04990, partial [Chthoniobacterales bacterium]|nr:hypothetical protein [Chthoniobacterales bacterium]